MLRRPSTYHRTLREEGCSSTAFVKYFTLKTECWRHPANVVDSVFRVKYFTAAP
jgi:hypothetical protein